MQPTPAGKTALEQILDGLKHDSILIMLGSGDPHLEQRLADIMVRYPHALLLRGYNESLAQQIYNSGDLFLMPSSFEPWGVVVHEHAAAGFPLLLSDAVGAGERFLEAPRNGTAFRARSAEHRHAVRPM